MRLQKDLAVNFLLVPLVFWPGSKTLQATNSLNIFEHYVCPSSCPQTFANTRLSKWCPPCLFPTLFWNKLSNRHVRKQSVASSLICLSCSFLEMNVKTALILGPSEGLPYLAQKSSARHDISNGPQAWPWYFFKYCTFSRIKTAAFMWSPNMFGRGK